MEVFLFFYNNKKDNLKFYFLTKTQKKNAFDFLNFRSTYFFFLND